MSAIAPLKQPICFWLAALVLVLPALTRAQDAFPSPTPTDPLACVPVQVLDQQQVTIGTHTITFKRIAPPVFPDATSTPPSQTPPTTRITNRASRAVPARRTSSRAPEIARLAQSDAGGDEEKPYKMLLLSATVYDHRFTEVRWNDGAGAALRAYVNIDLRYFTTVANLETDDAVYDLVFAWGDDTADSISRAGRQPPNLAAFPPGRSSYQIVAGDASARPDALAALDALCIYFDAHGARMVADYNQQQADNAAHRQWLRDHPPAQPDTVIHYWPLKSRVYTNPSHQ